MTTTPHTIANTTTGTPTPFIRACCRVCLAQESVMIYVYDRVEENDVTLAELLEICGGVSISKADQYTKLICHECTTELILFAKFREKCQTSEKTLNKLIDTFSEKQLEKLIYCINNDDKEIVGKIVDAEMCVDNGDNDDDDGDGGVGVGDGDVNADDDEIYDNIYDNGGDNHDDDDEDDDDDGKSLEQRENVLFKESETQQNYQESSTVFLVPTSYEDNATANLNNKNINNTISTSNSLKMESHQVDKNEFNEQDVYFDINNDNETTDAVIIDETYTDGWENDDDNNDCVDQTNEPPKSTENNDDENVNDEKIYFNQLIEECHLEQNDNENDVDNGDGDDDGEPADIEEFTGEDIVDDVQVLYTSDTSSEMGDVIIENEPIKLKKPAFPSKVVINYSCQVCGAGFMHFINLKRHIYSHQQFKQIFTCDMCSIVFLCPDEYQKHNDELHGDPLPMIKQTKKDSQMENVIYNGVNDLDDLNVAICQEDITKDRNLYEKNKISKKLYHQRPTIPAKENIKISFNKNPTQQINLGEKELTNSIKKSSSPKISSPSSPSLQLPPLQLSSTQQLTTTTTTTTTTMVVSKKLHTCNYCERTFVSNSLLKVHERVHTGERPYQCDNCAKTFTTRGGLDLHMRRHTGIKPFQCQTCQRSFVESSNLRVHMRIHTGEKPHSCNQCGRSFSRVFLLQIHQRTHTGERPYPCDHCGRAFSQQGDLAAHKRIHTGERPHKCDVCGKGFIKSSALTSHLRRHDKYKSFE